MRDSVKQRPGGLVILFEGVDGAGKTTQLQLAKAELERQGWTVHATRNLGGTPIGEALRTVTHSDTPRSANTDLYISIAIQTALGESLAEERAKGKVILIDRGPLSLAAYHIFGSQADEKLGWQYADKGMKDFKPELVLLYDLPLDTALGRTTKSDYFAKKPKGYFERVMEGFKQAGDRYKAAHIDATRSIEQVHGDTMAAISEVLSPPVKH